MQLAAEANSMAHHTRDEMRDERARQAGINIELRAQIEKLDGKVDVLGLQVAQATGVAHGEGRTTRLWLSIAALLVAGVGLIPHFLRGVHP